MESFSARVNVKQPNLLTFAESTESPGGQFLEELTAAPKAKTLEKDGCNKRKKRKRGGATYVV